MADVTPQERATVDAMTETMACRGPDDRGTFTTEHAAPGHHRLAIIVGRPARYGLERTLDLVLS